MNEYLIRTPNPSVTLQWFGDDAGQVRREAERMGHKVESVKFIKQLKRPICPGVVYKCDQEGHFCPMHGEKDEVQPGS